MRTFKYAPLAVMLAVVPQVNADSMPVPHAYVKVPFSGASPAQETPTFGFALEQNAAFNKKSTPMLNLEFKGEELDAVNINGLNVLEKTVTFDANGNAQTQSGINWKIVGWSALGVVAAAHIACVHGHEQGMEWAGFGDDCDDDSRRAVAAS